MKKTFYYTDELNDDFGGTVENVKPLPKDYKYVSTNVFFKLFEFVIYYIIARPIVWLYAKIKLGQRFKNKKVIKGIKGGFFIYGNHTLMAGDAFVPNSLTFKRKNHVIVGAETASLTCILPLLNALGMIPLGQDRQQCVGQLRCVKKRIAQGHTVTVYPEAHIWPYYTGIRPFKADSFGYAVITGAPIVCMTNCFQKRRFFKSPKVVTYLDGPFYPKEGLSRVENIKYLRDLTYDAMCKRAKAHSTYIYYEYKKKGEDNGEGNS